MIKFSIELHCNFKYSVRQNRRVTNREENLTNDWFALEHRRAVQMANHYFIMARISDYFCAGVGEPQETIIKPEPLSSSPNEMQFIIRPFVQRYLIAFTPKDLRICI